MEDVSAIVDDSEIVAGREFLLQHWNCATLGLASTATDKNAWFERLWNAYSEEGRHYHTNVHLQEMLSYFDLFWQTSDLPLEISRSDEEKQAIVLSTFFHDAVYDGRSGTNEEDSAVLFQTFAEEMGLDSTSSLWSKVVDYILATKKHVVSNENPPALSLFLDLDMAVLGKEAAAYRQYAAFIRKEYSFVSHEEYCEKRADILQGFLLQPIYGTRVMKQTFKDQARENLRNEIDSLRKGIVPGDGE
jgi:predicted metal-dependent HD superfamily phosphohydrolase